MMAERDLSGQLEKMQREWDERARENARFYVNTERQDWTDAEFFESGERTVSEEILTDMINICQGKDPKRMRVLEIGCGAGRVTRALAQIFGEVYGVDISGEMVRQARAALVGLPHVRIFQNSGKDLDVLGSTRFDLDLRRGLWRGYQRRDGAAGAGGASRSAACPHLPEQRQRSRRTGQHALRFCVFVDCIPAYSKPRSYRKLRPRGARPDAAGAIVQVPGTGWRGLGQSSGRYLARSYFFRAGSGGYGAAL